MLYDLGYISPLSTERLFCCSNCGYFTASESVPQECPVCDSGTTTALDTPSNDTYFQGGKL
jgi:hypothetical protein